jgi:hypothetical protein
LATNFTAASATTILALDPANLRQIAHRVGQKRREQDAEDASRAGDGAA